MSIVVFVRRLMIFRQYSIGWAVRLSSLLSISSESRFRNNFIKVARANLFAMGLPIVAVPILSRLFVPSDFGTLAVFGSVLDLLLAFSTWRFDWVLPNARTMGMAASLLITGTAVLALICVLTFLALLLLEPSVLSGTPLGQLGQLQFLLPIALFGGGLRLMFSGWFVRHGDLTAVSRATIAQSTTNVVVSILTGLAKLGALGLIGAMVLAVWAGISTLAYQVGLRLILGLRRVSLFSLRAAVSRHGRNATWSTVVAIVNALSHSAPILIFAYFYLPREIGWYALMYRLVAVPTGALASALGQSFWSQAAEYARANRIADLRQLYRRVTIHLGIACIPVGAICLAGPLFVGAVLGEQEWGGAGYVLIAMIPLFMGSILFSPTNHLVVLDKQHLQLVCDTARLVLIALSVSIAGYLGFGFVVAVALAALSSFLGHIILFIIHLRIYRDHERSRRQDILEQADLQPPPGR